MTICIIISRCVINFWFLVIIHIITLIIIENTRFCNSICISLISFNVLIVIFVTILVLLIFVSWLWLSDKLIIKTSILLLNSVKFINLSLVWFIFRSWIRIIYCIVICSLSSFIARIGSRIIHYIVISSLSLSIAWDWIRIFNCVVIYSLSWFIISIVTGMMHSGVIYSLILFITRIRTWMKPFIVT
jgi:hypothetical protein